MKKKKKSDKDMMSKQEHELDYLQQHYGVSREEGRKAIDAVGHSRKKVLEYLRNQNIITEPLV